MSGHLQHVRSTHRTLSLASDQRTSSIRVLPSGAVLYHSGDPAAYCYEILSGAVLKSKFTSDGRRQITGFRFAAEVLGLDGIGGTYQVTVQAIGTTELRVRRHRLPGSSGEMAFDQAGGMWLWDAMYRELQRVRRQVAILGHPGALPRTCAFLLDLSERLPGVRRLGSRVVMSLPMSRRDIADCLGLSLETTSRTLNALRRSGHIDMPSPRRVEIRDTAALEAVCGWRPRAVNSPD